MATITLTASGSLPSNRRKCGSPPFTHRIKVDGLPHRRYGKILIILVANTGDCQEWNVTLHFYDEKQPNNLGHVIDVICPNAEKHVFAIPTGAKQMAIRSVHFIHLGWQFR